MNKSLLILVKILFAIIYIPSMAFANTYSAIDYIITPVLTTNPPYVKVEAEIIGQMAGEIIVDLPYKWGGANYSSQIKNVQLKQPHGSIKFQTDNVNQAIITIPETQNANSGLICNC